MRCSITILLLLLWPPWAQAQGFVLSRVSGAQVAGKVVGVRGAGAARTVVLATEGVQIAIPLAELLAFHGPAPRVHAPVTAYLTGGEELKGDLSGGDDGGYHLIFKSATLGTRTIPVDRLRCLVFRKRALGSTAEAFALAPDAKFEGALFRKARRGFDVLGGELERFAAEGVHFAQDDQARPRLFRYRTLTALTIRGVAEPKDPGDWLLVTTTGDRLRVALTAVTGTHMELGTGFGPVSLAHGQIAVLTKISADHVFLSDLSPVRVAESGSEGALGAEPLYSYRRDRTASGGMIGDEASPADGFLVVSGRTYGKGLGVHSQCTLTYRVPPKMTRFHAKVAIDDEVKSLGVKGDVDVVVRIGAKVLFQKKGLRLGRGPISVGTHAVKPGALLTLEVQFGKGLFLGDRVDWLSAVFLR
jgi:NPCBM/NEW2 domain